MRTSYLDGSAILTNQYPVTSVHKHALLYWGDTLQCELCYVDFHVGEYVDQRRCVNIDIPVKMWFPVDMDMAGA